VKFVLIDNSDRVESRKKSSLMRKSLVHIQEEKGANPKKDKKSRRRRRGRLKRGEGTA